MIPLRQLPRLLRIAGVLARHRVDELLPASRRPRSLAWLRALMPAPGADLLVLPRGERLALALTALGPIFVKFGQILSTRRDLLPADVADALTQLQDRVAPFPAAQARAAIERAFGATIEARYASFDDAPLASASIAQVHAATLADGREVVVKVLRPDIHARIDADVALLRALAGVVERTHPSADKIRPQAIVDEIETTLVNELDLQREGANASLLRRNFAGSDDLYVPEVVWSHTSAGVLTLERVRGIPVDDLAALDAAGIDRVALAEKGVRLFYTQVFRDNFFHADAHAGNIWVDATRPADPRFIALDFGIMGSLPERDQYWLAENFLALFNQDYARIAELHVRAGWMPADARLDELEAAVRTVCEPYFTRPLSEISLAEVVVKLFEVARRHDLTLQPQLILLQKTLLNIEGVGRLLHPRIDIWATAKPVLERIWRRRSGPRAVLRTLRRRVPEWLAAAPDMPQLVHGWLSRANAGEMELRVASDDLKEIERRLRHGQRVAIWLSAGVSLAVATACVALLAPAGAPPGARWVAWLLGAAAVGAFALAARRS
ncbi:2-octaprenylphenol hydroxylase [Dokdonella fugitiva]|jgi:ubiquinone biosynthesis protein|uniref:2-octaprenylphenol hydroxylase n=1 Tax=Dokdonella fugitiva TaxID=328517 RepID=A0A4R2IH97_9GAMM|nr:ubiquinone biosynthesis regulatory protein kinase UbiB [Dokdonella fugitiva]MBA8882904.1 ubiquinone biosynthesis protein [Dokdonella fugitiva]TCO43118.1 2-octaprenylphenol hydroxylase [Dokdonella fugitiva]